MEFNKSSIIVFSHLRWEFVYQRPQHIISRLVKKRKILFIEEPISNNDNEGGDAKIYKDGDVTIVQPKINRDNLMKELIPIINRVSLVENIENPLLWFYSPEFVEIIEEIKNSGVIFDCMDQLTAFKGASEKLLNQEKTLLSIADIVFTGGKSLYEEKRMSNINTYCFPSSVDSNHFRKANDARTKIPEDFRSIKNTIVGYYGVIDERIDLDLLAKTADLMPDITFAMIGPVVKIGVDELPQRKNIFYAGSKPYEMLPSYLKKINIAMMPFALNRSTKFISPTKTLEYMAAGKPIISTPIFDVVRDYKSVIKIVNNESDFVNSINYYLNENSQDKAKRLTEYKEILERTSWDKTVYAMEEVMSEYINKKFNNVYTKQSQVNSELSYALNS